MRIARQKDVPLANSTFTQTVRAHLKKIIMAPSIILISFFMYWQTPTLEYELINDIFLDIVGTEYYYADPGYPKPPPLDTIQLYSEREALKELANISGQSYEYLKATFDSTHLEEFRKLEKWKKDDDAYWELVNNPIEEHRKLLVFVEDTLIANTGIVNRNIKENIQYDLSNKEILFAFRDTMLESKAIDIHRIWNTGKYVIRESSEYQRSDETVRTTVLLRFSRILFNESKDEAFLYVSIVCGRLCGEGKFLYVKKEKNKWLIKEREELWIS